MVKRLFDIVCSSIGLVLLAPILAVAAIVIKSDSPGPVFFRQERVGQHFRYFRIFKFRTMVVNAESRGAQVSTGDDPRITPIGFFLRKYKLDELPQLINVIIGDMSLVGPRPEVPRYVEAFRKEYVEVLSVKPGITDFASLEYRDENELLRGILNPEEKYLAEILPAKIEYYRKYIREQSLLTDTKLILRTLAAIVWRR
jgi:lipopolysaccharide/colanic/teichoic acid biosynthesis glycosyltransferase